MIDVKGRLGAISERSEKITGNEGIYLNFTFKLFKKRNRFD